jgi:hypothetical protein
LDFHVARPACSPSITRCSSGLLAFNHPLLVMAGDAGKLSGLGRQFPSKSLDQPFQATLDLCLCPGWSRPWLYD